VIATFMPFDDNTIGVDEKPTVVVSIDFLSPTTIILHRRRREKTTGKENNCDVVIRSECSISTVKIIE
jgi:hypothetical protein